MTSIRYQNDGIIVAESPPSCRTISCQNRGVRKATKYRLAFPWMIFVISHRRLSSNIYCTDGVHLGFRNSELTDTDQMLCYPNIYNIHAEDLMVCMDMVRGSDADDLVRNTLSEFWNSNFDWSSYIHEKYTKWNAYTQDGRITKLESWAACTLADPNFILDVKWKQAFDLNAVIDKIRDKEDEGNEEGIEDDYE